MKNDKNTLLQSILRSNKTVFSFKELHMLSNGNDSSNLRAKLSYYNKTGDLYHIRRGLYAKDQNYNKFEVATKIMTPAYISFETVLRSAGVIFQYHESIYVASTHSRIISCDGQQYIYRRIKQSILLNRTGVQRQDAYSIATPERAFLDLLYLNNDFYLDNPSQLNWKLIYEMLPIYQNKRMQKVVDQHYAQYLENLREKQ